MILQLFLMRTLGFPVWWYGKGLAECLKWLLTSISSVSNSLAIRVWMKNLFVPMYGDTSAAGRAISFFIRLVMILVRGVGIILYSILLIGVFLTYLILPFAAVIGVLYHASSLF